MLRRIALILTILLAIGLTTRLWAQPNPLAVSIMNTDATTAAPTVNVFVSVVDEAAGQTAVSGLPASAFTLLEEARPISTTVSEESVGLALVILMDRSGSMGEPGPTPNQTRMDSARAVVQQLIDEKLTNADLVGLIGFHEEQDPQQELTYDHNLIFNAVETIEFAPDRNTSLFDTTGRALDWLTDNTDPARRAALQRMRKTILIFSDGVDTTSQVWRREDVRDRALANNIRLHTVAIASQPGVNVRFPADPADLRWLAEQTRGRTIAINTAEEQTALAGFFDQLVSQRQQYRLAYTTQALKGAHPIRVLVSANGMTGEASGEIITDLMPPTITLVEPANGFFQDLRQDPDTPLPIVVAASFPDGRVRNLRQVDILANGEKIGAATPVGDGIHYRLEWTFANLAPSDVETDITLLAVAEDALLPAQRVTSGQNVSIRVLPVVPPAPPQVWWLSGLVGVLGIGLIALAVLLVLTRRQIGRTVSRVGAAAGTVLRSITKPLGGGGLATAKLQVINGPNIGAEYRIERDMTAIGRDPTRCEVILADPYISGLHFTIERQANDYYQIVHHGSNPTEVNYTQLPKETPTPLPLGSKIRLGSTEMQFVQIGGKTVPV